MLYDCVWLCMILYLSIVDNYVWLDLIMNDLRDCTILYMIIYEYSCILYGLYRVQGLQFFWLIDCIHV